MQNMPRAESALLSPEERRILLEEIARIGLALGRQLQMPDESADNLPLSPHVSIHSPGEATPHERLALLLAVWTKGKEAIHGILRQADSALVSTRLSVPLARSRGLPKTGSLLARTSQGANAWFATSCESALRGDCERQMILDERLQQTTETDANRFVTTLLLSIQEEAEALARLAAFCEADAEADLVRALAGDAAALRSLPPIRGLSPLDAAATRRLLASGELQRCPPPYRLLSDVWRQLTSELQFDWSGSPLLRLPALEAWHLYEIWCFLQTAGALSDAGWRLVDGDAIRRHARGLRLELVTGQASCLRFRCAEDPSPSLELHYQPYFTSANRFRGEGSAPRQEGCRSGLAGIGSRSHVMQPDIALLYHERLFLLDAKFRDYAPSESSSKGSYPAERSAFRQPGARQEDIDKMHTYRDALHRDGAGVVEAAWSLFPGSVNGPLLFAYPESRPEHPFGTAGVGAVRLRPGQSCNTFVQLLASWTCR